MQTWSKSHGWNRMNILRYLFISFYLCFIDNIDIDDSELSGLITSATHTAATPQGLGWRRKFRRDVVAGRGTPDMSGWESPPGAAPSHGPRQAAVASGGLGENMGFQMGFCDVEGLVYSMKPPFIWCLTMFDWLFCGKTMFFLQIYPLTTVGQRADVNWGVPQKDRYSRWGLSVATKLAPRRVETSWLTTRWGWIWRFTKLHPMDMPWTWR